MGGTSCVCDENDPLNKDLILLVCKCGEVQHAECAADNDELPRRSHLKGNRYDSAPPCIKCGEKLEHVKPYVKG